MKHHEVVYQTMSSIVALPPNSPKLSPKSGFNKL